MCTDTQKTQVFSRMKNTINLFLLSANSLLRCMQPARSPVVETEACRVALGSSCEFALLKQRVALLALSQLSENKKEITKKTKKKKQF